MQQTMCDLHTKTVTVVSQCLCHTTIQCKNKDVHYSEGELSLGVFRYCFDDEGDAFVHLVFFSLPELNSFVGSCAA